MAEAKKNKVPENTGDAGKLDLGSELKNVKDSLASLKQSIGKETSAPSMVDAKNVFDQEKKENSLKSQDLAELEKKIDDVTVSHTLEKHLEKASGGDGKISNKQESIFAKYVQETNNWLQSSTLPGKKERVAASNGLIKDIFEKDPNPIANAVRKVAERFLS